MNTGFTAIIADDEPLLRRHLDKSLAEVYFRARGDSQSRGW